MSYRKELENRLHEVGHLLAAELKPEGNWEGRLSSSALAVAVSVAALYFHRREEHSEATDKGLRWLCDHMNADGSYGDTPQSPGNVSTSLLVYAAFNLFRSAKPWTGSFQDKVAAWLSDQGIDVHSAQVSEVILAHYQKDYTFSVPILAMCGLCGVPGESAFEYIPQLPFELSLMPRRLYRVLNLSVVSYAIPALVAVGIVIFKKKRSNAAWKLIRHFSIPKALKILKRMLPESGGYLEASPLTAFVVLSLINSGYSNEVVEKGIGFLRNTQRDDGSWPIDVDLSNWVTSLSVKAYRSNLDYFLPVGAADRIAGYFRQVQNKNIHPFNGTQPGGWGWTSYPGSVPDGDDTPGAILALLRLQEKKDIRAEVYEGCKWLFSLQNKDGGIPTFSKGWGRLPFDQSCSDLTGHCMLAFSSVLETYSDEQDFSGRKLLVKSFERALMYLRNNISDDGSWLPLWFGNQFAEKHANPVYGTARVVSYLTDVCRHEWLPGNLRSQVSLLIEKGSRYLISVQNSDGSWGGGKNIEGTIEETSLAVSALASAENWQLCIKALEWVEQFRATNGFRASPIGLYFASLWYDEKLYPVTAYLEALSRMLELTDDRE